MNTLTSKRIASIDVLRGIIMVIMALDHVRDYLHITGFSQDALEVATTTPILYVTRWVTHICAPMFLFLSGTAVYLQGLKKARNVLSVFLLKRGLWLVIAQVTVVGFSYTFDPLFRYLPLMVIWAIGISMMILGGLIFLPYRFILVMGLLIVFGHNLLDIPEAMQGFEAGFGWDLLHHGYNVDYPLGGGYILALWYPFLPWLGVMLLGYCAGVLFVPGYDAAKRRRILYQIGGGAIVFFFVLRYANFYGDPHPWMVQENIERSLFSFFKVCKYPPSLLFISITVGIGLVLLSAVEGFHNRLNGFFNTFGRTAFFYYIVHFYLIHLLCMIGFFLRGNTLERAIIEREKFPFMFAIPGEGYSLFVVYLLWIGVVLGLYPICRWYDGYKTNHPEKWWLRYL